MAVATLAEKGARHALECRNDNEHKVLAQNYVMRCMAEGKAQLFSTLGLPLRRKTAERSGEVSPWPACARSPPERFAPRSRKESFRS